MKKTLFLLVLTISFISCEGNKKSFPDKEFIEGMIFNMTIDSLKESDGISNVFAHFYYEVELTDLKRVFKVVDPLYTDDELDSLCAVYDYKCSFSIHELLNEKNEGLIVYNVYDFPDEEDFSKLGYPILVSKTKVVSMYSHFNNIGPHTYEENRAAFVFEKKNNGWKITNHVIFSSGE